LVACTPEEPYSENLSEEPIIVKVGVVGSFNDQWDVVNENLEAEGIYVELIHFTEGSLVNPALHDGDIDLNAFQNVGFFVNQVEEHGYDLTDIGHTFISPMNIFAGENLDVVADGERETLAGLIPDGASIGIPNNMTNAGRALKLLEAAGLITLDPVAGYLVNELDIIDNPFNIEIVQVEAGNLVNLLPDLDAAVINAPQALTGGLSPTYDSIFREDAFNLEMADDLVNIIVARSEDGDNPVFNRIIKAYQTQAVADVFATTFEGAFVPAWD
jgi:D-methionine transport system substrate-binding protein